jgi:hypothetical protein
MSRKEYTMNFGAKELLAIGAPYLISVAACYLFWLMGRL